jgi:hypothetical protein
LFQLFDLSNIDWLEIDKQSENSLVKQACDLWNSGKNIDSISNELQLAKCTISDYLKRGAIINWCNYDIRTEKLKCVKKASNARKKESCLRRITQSI